jgi:hypothetical protein
MKRHRTPFVPLTAFIVLACCASAAPAADQCERWEQQRERLEQQMRRPHSAAQGNRLRARMRDLRERIAHDCR